MTTVKPICANCSDVPRLRLAVGFLILTALHGFAREEIKVYRVPKPSQPAQALPAGHPELPAAGVAAQPKFKWLTPVGWTEVAPGEMRVASFSIKSQDNKQADVSVVPLPGKAGGDAANVNRWRGQVALPALPADEVRKLAEAVKVGDQPGELYDVSGTNTSSGEPSRILAVIHHREGTAWFFKMTGDPQLVGQQKPAFVEFLKSSQFSSAEASPTLPPSHPPIEGNALPPGHPEVSSTPLPAGEPAREGQPKWQSPKSWKEVPGGQFLVAKFLVTGKDNAQAAVNVSRSAGDGGGLAGNVNRWRTQLGLSQLSAEELAKAVQPVKLSNGEASWVEMSGTDARSGQSAKLVGVMVPQGGQTWFYKLMGDPKIVADQQDAFKQFVQSATY
jgi:hypothetical protein